MRLVDGEAGDRRLGEEASKRRGREALRRHVEKSQPARAHGALGVAALGRRSERVERRGGDSLARELVDLILHQGDQGRDDERRTVEQEGGELIPDRLPGAGRHHGEHVTARERGKHDVLLARAEGRVAEVAAKGVPGVYPLHSAAPFGHYSPNGWQCGPTRCRLRRSP